MGLCGFGSQLEALSTTLHGPSRRQKTGDTFSDGTMQASRWSRRALIGPRSRLRLSPHLLAGASSPDGLGAWGRGMHIPRTSTQGISLLVDTVACLQGMARAWGVGIRMIFMVSDPVSLSHRARGFQPGTILETERRMNISCPMISYTREALIPEKGVSLLTQQRY